MDPGKFVIVTFVDEDDAPGIVVSNWIKDSNTCYYPDVRNEEMKNKLLKRMAEPEITWRQYHIKILKAYETYGEARLHLKKAEETSNLDSDEEVGKRKRKINSIYLSEDSNSCVDYPPSKSTKAEQILSKKRNEYIKYPTPPKPKSAKQNMLATQFDVDEIKPYDVVELSDMPMEVNSTVNFSHKENTSCPTGGITSKQFSIQLSHLIQIVSDLSKEVAQLNRKVDLLLGRSGETANTHTDDNPAISELLASLPVKDDASFDHFNDQLKISQNKQAIMSYLAGIGGRNVRSLTTNILRRILIDEVAEVYSLTGKQMKNSFKKSFLCTDTYTLIFQICKKVYDDVTEDNLRQVISDWLNQAKVRLSRRAERQNKNIKLIVPLPD